MEWSPKDDTDEVDESENWESHSASDQSDSQSENEEPIDAEAEAAVEKEIEGDFRRLVNNIKGGNDKGTGTSSIWDISIEEQEGFDLHEELKAASGIGRRKRRGRGPRDKPVLSQQVKSLLGEANTAYVSQNIPETIRLMQEVVRIEPREASAWTTLALCHTDMGEPEKALQLHIVGAHLVHDVDLWLKLGTDSRNLGFFQQALYCYRKACTLDPGDVNAQWDRAFLSKEIGDLRTARTAFLAILKRYPHDISALEELRPILVELSDVPRGIDLYQAAFEHYQEAFPSGKAQDASGNEIPGGGFGDMQIIVLADFYNSVADPEKALTTIRRGARWLQGRSEQRYWDNEVDDREYDLEGYTRLGSQPVAVSSYPLDLNFRHRLAVARLMLGEYEEGQLHSNVILQHDIREHAVLLTEIADVMFDQGLHEDALGIYETLSADETTSSFRIVLQAAACHRSLGNLSEAAQIYQHIITGDPEHIDAKMKLAEIYEAMSEPKKALHLVYEVIDARRRNSTRDGLAVDSSHENVLPTDSLFQEKTSRGKAKKHKPGMTLAQLQALELEHEAATKRGFEALKRLAPDVKNGSREAEAAWLLEAETLIESFRQVKPLFPSTRIEFRGMPAWRRSKRGPKDDEKDEDNMASRLQLELEYDKVSPKVKKNTGEKVTAFRCVSFDDWLFLFVEYGFLLTARDQYSLADEVLRHAMQSVVFQEPIPVDTLRLALIACAIRVGDHETIVSMSRKLINSHQFHNDPPRILLAALASGLLSVDAFIDSRLQKHISREVRLIDSVVKGKEVRWNPHTRRYTQVGTEEGEKDDGKDEADEAPEETGPASGLVENAIPQKPTKNNPIMVCIYGQLCVAARSYQSGIFYLLHAYEYQPNDPVICLSLALAYLGRAMQRQADNRHYMIAQSLAFLSQYRNLRMTDDANADEVDFNFGRAFHQIGLFHHASKHYQRVLANTERCMQDDPNNVGVSREAAYNLSLIYMSTGAVGLAKALYRKWLSI
ncbi:TPR-like protein [Ramaria rubella]|nr:TPR-like protein [Ramaria rubella]